MARKNKKTDNTSQARRFRWGRFVLSAAALFFRTVLFTVMLVLLLGASAWIVFNSMFNAQQLSERLTDYLQRLFDRPVVVSSLSLKFLNTVELRGFAVLDDRVQPGSPILSAESVTVRYKLAPLLDNRLEISEITLNKPRIRIVRSENGVINVPAIKTEHSQDNFVSESTSQRVTVSIEDWRIRDGVLSYKDLEAGVSHAIYGLNAHFYHLRFDELSRFRLHTVLQNRWGDHVSDLEIRGTGQVNFADFDWSRFALRNFKTQVALFRKPVSLTIDIDNLQTPFFSVKAEVPAFDNQDLSVFHKDLPVFNVPASKLNARGHISKNYTLLNLEEMAAVTDNLNATVSGKLDFSASPFTADLQLQTGWNNLAVLSKRWPSLARFNLSGQGKMSATVLRKNGQYELPILELAAKEAAGFFWGFETAGVSGSFQAKKNFTDLYAQVTDGHVQVAKTSFDKLQLTGSYRGGNVEAYISSGLLNEVPFKMNLSIEAIKSAKRKINTAMYLQHFEPMPFIDVVIDFADVISNIGDSKTSSSVLQTGELAWMRNFRDRLPTFMPNFSGTLYADTFSSTVLSGKRFNAEFAFTGLLPGAKDLTGTLDVKLEEGIIHQMEKLAEEQEALNVTFTPFIMMHRMERSGSFKVGEVLKDVAFDEMAASVDFKNGTMIINNAFTQGPVISAAVSGWVDWVRETFELVIWTMFTPNTKKRGILAENLTDESGNPALAFKVSSSMLKPRLEMLRAKKTNEQIQAARKRGLRTDFKKSRDFVKGEFHAKK